MAPSSTYFDLRSQLNLLTVRSFTVADESHLSPRDSNPYYIGEYFQFEVSGGITGKIERAADYDIGFVNIAEIGSPDIQLNKKLPLIMAGEFLAMTKITGVTTSDTPGPLRVDASVTVDGVNKSGLSKFDISTSGTHGYQVGVLLNMDIATSGGTPYVNWILYLGHAPKYVVIP